MRNVALFAMVLALACEAPELTRKGPPPQKVSSSLQEYRSLPPVPAVEEPMRVGGDVKPPIAMHRVEPKLGEVPHHQFFYIFEAVITKNGDVRDVRALKGNDETSRNIAAALRQWKFKPGTLHGKPVDVIYTLTVNLHPR